MPTLADIMSFIDARKRTLANTARDIADDPVGGAKLAGTRMIDMLKSGAQNQLDAAGNMMSVMPGGMESGVDQLLSGPLGAAPLGLTAYHGTPHTFDKFDMSKVGTGEGAQMYGHGLYFAEHPDVAKGYRERLSGTNTTMFTLGGKDVGYIGDAKKELLRQAKANGYSNESAALVAHELEQAGGDLDSVAGKFGWLDQPTPIHEEAASLARELQYKPHGGNLYKVDIPDEHVEKMLVWNKPLQQQSQPVQDAIARLMSDPNSVLAKNLKARRVDPEAIKYASGQWVMDYLGGGAVASDALRSVGIPGIKYPDQWSRPRHPGTPHSDRMGKTEKQTHNFVLFDDEIPKIIGRE